MAYTFIFCCSEYVWETHITHTVLEKRIQGAVSEVINTAECTITSLSTEQQVTALSLGPAGIYSAVTQEYYYTAH